MLTLCKNVFDFYIFTILEGVKRFIYIIFYFGISLLPISWKSFETQMNCQWTSVAIALRREPPFYCRAPINMKHTPYSPEFDNAGCFRELLRINCILSRELKLTNNTRTCRVFTRLPPGTFPILLSIYHSTKIKTSFSFTSTANKSTWQFSMKKET